MIGREEPADYASYCASMRRVADDLQAWKESRKFRAPLETQPTQVQQPVAESMDWEPTRTTAAAAARTRQGSPRGPRAQWVSDAVRKQRWEARVCLRCGSQDHVQAGCNLRPAKPPVKTEETCKGPQKSKVASTSARKKPVVGEVFTDDSETGEDSGKE
ncbi:hypothetical protein DL98DRAFT_599331 [Cadophora sp. DSE1049]|nr:hypothetical protein DL98DRAFT_599331 [Cadophora sp. DSE1049]